jgi:hypothetical protein
MEVRSFNFGAARRAFGFHSARSGAAAAEPAGDRTSVNWSSGLGRFSAVLTLSLATLAFAGHTSAAQAATLNHSAAVAMTYCPPEGSLDTTCCPNAWQNGCPVPPNPDPPFPPDPTPDPAPPIPMPDPIPDPGPNPYPLPGPECPGPWNVSGCPFIAQ